MTRGWPSAETGKSAARRPLQGPRRSYNRRRSQPSSGGSGSGSGGAAGEEEEAEDELSCTERLRAQAERAQALGASSIWEAIDLPPRKQAAAPLLPCTTVHPVCE